MTSHKWSTYINVAIDIDIDINFDIKVKIGGPRYDSLCADLQALMWVVSDTCCPLEASFDGALTFPR